MVGDAVVLVVVGPDLLAAAAASDLTLPGGRRLGILAFLFGLENAGPQHGHRPGPVLDLAPLVLHRDDGPRRLVGDSNCGVCRVDTLSTCARRPVDIDLEVAIVDDDVNLLGFGKDGDRGR